MEMRGECGHRFCRICVTQVWSGHMAAEEVERLSVYQCAACQQEAIMLVERGEHRRENMPFQVDGGMERMLRRICEQGRKLGEEIEMLKEGGSVEGEGWEEGEWGELEG